MGRRSSRSIDPASTPFLQKRRGQLQLVSIAAFLFLLPAAVIVAQNASIDANAVADPTIEIPIDTVRIVPPADTALAPTSSEEVVADPATVVVDEPDAGVDLDAGPATSRDPEPADRVPVDTDLRTDRPEEVQRPPAAGPTPSVPELVAKLQTPLSVVRGEQFSLQVVVENVGTATATDIRFTYQLPSGFSAGMTTPICTTLLPGERCEQAIEIATDAAASLGPADIHAVVTYV